MVIKKKENQIRKTILKKGKVGKKNREKNNQKRKAILKKVKERERKKRRIEKKNNLKRIKRKAIQ